MMMMMNNNHQRQECLHCTGGLICGVGTTERRAGSVRWSQRGTATKQPANHIIIHAQCSWPSTYTKKWGGGMDKI